MCILLLVVRLVQSDGLAMDSHLGPVLGDNFMLELKSTLVPMLTEYMKFWKRYVDDTICFVKLGSVQHIVSILNSFDLDIQFTNEMEKKCRLTILDVLLKRDGNNNGHYCLS